jgi:hypothetical protein
MDFRTLFEGDSVAVVATFAKDHVKVAGCNEDESATKNIPFAGFANFELRDFVEAIGESSAKGGRNVLDDANGREIRGEAGKHILECLGAASGCSNQNDLAGIVVRTSGGDGSRGRG